MTTRKVTGRVLNLQEQPEVNALVVFDFVKYSVHNEAYYIASTTTTYTDIQGKFEKVLWCNQQGDISSYYMVRIKDNNPIKIIVPLGTTDIALSVLEQGSNVPNDPQYNSLLTYVQQNITTPNARFKERIIVDSTVITNGGVILTNPINLAHMVQVFLNGIQQSYGFDFVIDNQKVSINTISLSDILEIFY